MKRSIRIEQPYVYRPKTNKRRGLVQVTDKRTYCTGIYTVNRNYRHDLLRDVLLVNIEESFKKNNLPDKIKEQASKMSYKDIVPYIEKIRFFTTTQEYELPFLREDLFDYYFHKNGDYIRSLFARPRGRVLNPHMYEALPLMPMGLTSRYFLEDRITHIYNQELIDYESEYLDERDHLENPIDVFSSIFDSSFHKTFDFTAHPMFFSVDENTQKRIIQTTIKGIVIWATFINDIVQGQEREAFTKHGSLYISQSCDVPDDVAREYYRMLGNLNILHQRKDYFFRLCGVDDFMFFRRVNNLKDLINYKLYDRINVKASLHDKNASLDGYEGWNICTILYLSNYMYHLLYFILKTLMEDEPAFQIMEQWFIDLQNHREEVNTNLFQKDRVKKYMRSYSTYGAISTTGYRGGQAKNYYNFNTYTFFITDEGIWQDAYIQRERTAGSYGQFLIPIDLMTLEDAFDAPQYLRMAQIFLDTASRANVITVEMLEKKWNRMQRMKLALSKESEEYYQEMLNKIPDGYLTV